jgi:hypothetical protein
MPTQAAFDAASTLGALREVLIVNRWQTMHRSTAARSA